MVQNEVKYACEILEESRDQGRRIWSKIKWIQLFDHLTIIFFLKLIFFCLNIRSPVNNSIIYLIMKDGMRGSLEKVYTDYCSNLYAVNSHIIYWECFLQDLLQVISKEL